MVKKTINTAWGKAYYIGTEKEDKYDARIIRTPNYKLFSYHIAVRKVIA